MKHVVAAWAVSIGSLLVLLSVVVLICSCTGALRSEISALARRAVPATIECHVIQPTWLQGMSGLHLTNANEHNLTPFSRYCHLLQRTPADLRYNRLIHQAEEVGMIEEDRGFRCSARSRRKLSRLSFQRHKLLCAIRLCTVQ